jgi:hypothetical protein
LFFAVEWVGIALSVEEIDTDRTVRGSNTGVCECAPIHTGPKACPVSSIMGNGSLPRVKRPGGEDNHIPLPSVDVKERVERYLYSTSGPLLMQIGFVWELMTFSLVDEVIRVLFERKCCILF